MVDFANALRNQASKCDYPDSVLDYHSSGFVAGLENGSTRQYIWSLPVFSVEKFDKLLELGHQYERDRRAEC